jgi:hypothetical protein
MIIKIPDHIKTIDFVTRKEVLPDGINPEVVTFNWWIQTLVLRDPRWSTDYKTLKRTQRIDAALATAKPGDAVTIETDDYEFLKDVVENPRYLTRGPRGEVLTMPGYENTLLARTVIPFIDAISKATDK